MADFQERAMGITGLTIDNSSTNPSRAEFSTFLNDGVLDVTQRSIEMDPREADKFARVVTNDSNDTVDIGGARIIAVMREANIDGSSDGSAAWRPCRKVSPMMASRVVDPESLSFASIYHPVYTINTDMAINVYPTPSSNNGIKVFYVNNAPEETDGSALDHASTGIKYFPSEKIHLVILYASIKCLEGAAGNKLIAQDIELQQSYTAMASALKAEYMSAFQQQQQQQAR